MYKENKSSGRWDASGSWDVAVMEQALLAASWALDMDAIELASVLEDMADYNNAYTLYERSAALHTAAQHLRQQ